MYQLDTAYLIYCRFHNTRMKSVIAEENTAVQPSDSVTNEDGTSTDRGIPEATTKQSHLQNKR